MEAALRACPADAGVAVPDALRAAAERLLQTVPDAPPGRDTALNLLAADTLMTYACEAAAELSPERLGEL